MKRFIQKRWYRSIQFVQVLIIMLAMFIGWGGFDASESLRTFAAGLAVGVIFNFQKYYT